MRKEVVSRWGVFDAYIATGADASGGTDALTGSALAARQGTGILLVGPRYNGELDDFLGGISSATVLGGIGAVPDEIAQAVEGALYAPAQEIPVTAISIIGEAVVGQTLTVSATTPKNATVLYQWMKFDGSAYDNITGANSETYTLVGEDAGKWVILKATGTGRYGGTIYSSGKLVAVAPVEASISEVVATNGTVTITLAAKPTVAPVTGDFTATIDIDGAGATGLTLVGFNYDENLTVTYTFSTIDQTVADQDVVVAVKLGEGEAVAGAAFTVDAADPINITAVSVTIAAPERNAVANITATVEDATSNLDYTVINIEWDPEADRNGKFSWKGHEIYTATVTLKSKNYKKFPSEPFTPTVAGSASVGETTTSGGAVVGNTVTFTVTFPPTPASTNATIRSTTIGTVDNTAETIAGIPIGTTLSGLKAAITPATRASFEVYEADGTTVATDLQDGYKVIVTAEDGTTTKAYTVELSGE